MLVTQHLPDDRSSFCPDRPSPASFRRTVNKSEGHERRGGRHYDREQNPRSIPADPIRPIRFYTNPRDVTDRCMDTFTLGGFLLRSGVGAA